MGSIFYRTKDRFKDTICSEDYDIKKPNPLQLMVETPGENCCGDYCLSPTAHYLQYCTKKMNRKQYCYSARSHAATNHIHPE